MSKRGSSINSVHKIPKSTVFDDMCERYSVIAEQTNLIIFDMNFVDDKLYVSDNFIESAGISVCNKKNILKCLLETKYIHPNDISKFKDFIRACSPKGASVSLTFRRRNEKGEYVWIRCKKKCYFDAENKLTRVLGTAQDISKEMVANPLKGIDFFKGQALGLPSFNKFEARTKRIRANYPGKKFAVIVLDVKRFSVINDLYGNKEGDSVLKYIGSILSSNKSSCYACCRLYADNFAVFTEYRNDSEIYDFAFVLKQRMKKYPLKMEIAFSIGVCRVDHADMPISVLCERANLTKKSIKHDVLKTLAFYEDSLRKRNLEDTDIENEMMSALKNHQFEMYLQPKMSIPTTEIVGAEALVRWNHPEKGLITPDNFIHLFEKNGFIVKLDYYIWEKAFRTIAGWIKENYPVIPISVNVSRVHFGNSDFVEKLIYLSERYHVPPTCIELEITESAFFNYKGDLQTKLYTLKDKGFKLSLDDFGTGYSTLNCLKDIPLDILKMDKAFLAGTGENRKEETVLEYTIALARSLGIEVVAEGVENFSQAEFLYRSGCEIAQGYFYSPPLPVITFEKYAGLT
ncbi:bifunctional diguanylate cyclase/phosphodiesterase [Anaerocolumna xylanovorans]|uniref:Diguanylate cyclase (GGDEF) domain-containing protein n=1 Tax=Anaerocolumna xylanovorans DSM 12503 TaxID=1121345 RepID=A0A1M7YKY9_9FIRM|nr:EAL domain-containing protein [Anaerocolumna xylanovorans]SHO53290.1 diguanylate cyclase (GGDEF) domain-containing protein [Anaerocolumna xylanovorans DSM 12503]